MSKRCSHGYRHGSLSLALVHSFSFTDSLQWVSSHSSQSNRSELKNKCFMLNWDLKICGCSESVLIAVRAIGVSWKQVFHAQLGFENLWLNQIKQDSFCIAGNVHALYSSYIPPIDFRWPLHLFCLRDFSKTQKAALPATDWKNKNREQPLVMTDRWDNSEAWGVSQNFPKVMASTIMHALLASFPFLYHFPTSLLCFPDSQINHLPLNPYCRICF